MDCSPPGSSVHGISQARVLQRVAISFSGGWISLTQRANPVSCISRTAGGFFSMESAGKPSGLTVTHDSDPGVLPAVEHVSRYSSTRSRNLRRTGVSCVHPLHSAMSVRGGRVVSRCGLDGSKFSVRTPACPTQELPQRWGDGTFSMLPPISLSRMTFTWL